MAASQRVTVARPGALHTVPLGVFTVRADRDQGAEQLVLPDAGWSEVLPDGDLLVDRIEPQGRQLYRLSLDRGTLERVGVRHLRRYNVMLADPGLCYRWGEVVHSAERAGHPVGVGDAWHAATALMLQAPLHPRLD